MKQQITDTILMIEPVAFGFNEQTAINNYFQKNQEDQALQSKALAEFNALVGALRAHGIQVLTLKDTPTPHTPDSIFPNNWVSFHQDARVALYPMFAENRRQERREDVFELLENHGFVIREKVDYTFYESEQRYLEGTGSMILDRANRIAYGALSLRLDEAIFREFCKAFDYEPVVFHAFQSVDSQRLPIYHTNVMMCLAEKFAVICLDCIDNREECALVQRYLEQSGKKIIPITEGQMHQFAGNMLGVRNQKGERFLVMSKSAFQSLTPLQIVEIEQFSKIIHADLSHIEQNGGGSARCMMAEIFLPKIG